MEDRDFLKDGLHLNGRGKRRLGQTYSKVSGHDVGGLTEGKSVKFWKMKITQREISGKFDHQQSKNTRFT
jgi:hypothetical protein